MRESISFDPGPDPREEARAFQPWWRRLGAWLAHFHKFVTVLVSVAGMTIAIHVWLKGLITRGELDLAVQAAVEKALMKTMLDVRSDLAVIKNSTGDLPAWRGDVTGRLAKVETKADGNAEASRAVTERVDRYLMARAR